MSFVYEWIKTEYSFGEVASFAVNCPLNRRLLWTYFMLEAPFL